MENLTVLKADFEEYLRVQRGLSEKSIYDCWRFADRFLAFRFKHTRPDLGKIRSADIARFMQCLRGCACPHFGHYTIEAVITLRDTDKAAHLEKPTGGNR